MRGLTDLFRLGTRRRLIRQLWVEFGASNADIARVDAVFAKYGLPAQAAEGYPLTGGPPVAIQWVVYVVLATPIGAFFATFGSEAGKDAYGAVKTWVQDLAAARQATGAAGKVQIHASDESSLVIPWAISTEALDALRQVDWNAMRGGHIIWSEQRKAWIDQAATREG